jgi:hypothetical protein
MISRFISVFYIFAVGLNKYSDTFVRAMFKKAIAQLVTCRKWNGKCHDPYWDALVGDSLDRVKAMKNAAYEMITSRKYLKDLESILNSRSHGIRDIAIASKQTRNNGIIWRPMFLQDLQRLVNFGISKHADFRLYPLLRCYYEFAKEIPDILVL